MPLVAYDVKVVTKIDDEDIRMASIFIQLYYPFLKKTICVYMWYQCTNCK